MLSRIRKALGGSPSDRPHEGQGTVAEAPVREPLDIVRDTARDLCSDAWLANSMTLEIKAEGGKKTLVATPAEALPFVKAAYAIRKDELPAEMKGMFESFAG